MFFSYFVNDYKKIEIFLIFSLKEQVYFLKKMFTLKLYLYKLKYNLRLFEVTSPHSYSPGFFRCYTTHVGFYPFIYKLEYNHLQNTERSGTV